MKTIVTALSAALLLSACNGQNPFKRESDPTKDYPNLNQAVPVDELPERKPTPEPPAPTPKAEQNPCLPKFYATVKGARGHLMKFSPGQKNEVILVVRSNVPGKPQMSLVGQPDGMNISPISSEGTAPGSKSYWAVTWTPKEALTSSTGVWETYVGVQYNNPSLKDAVCGSYAVEDFNVLVFANAKDVKNPIVSISGLPQSTIKIGDSAKFKVTVSNVSTSEMPVLNISKSQLYEPGDVLAANKAVGCEKGTVVKDSWEFSCDFVSANMTDAKTYIDRNVDVIGMFDISAMSEGKNSMLATGRVKVNFPGPIQTEKDAPKEKGAGT